MLYPTMKRVSNLNTFNRVICLLSLLLIATAGRVSAQEITKQNRQDIQQVVSRIVEREIKGGGARLNSVNIRGRRVRLHFSQGLANYPFREDNVAALYDSVKAQLNPKSAKRIRLEIYTDGNLIENLIPLASRRNFDRKSIVTFTNNSTAPLISRIDNINQPSKGLQNRHIALWQSHGLYFKQEENEWQWQRTPQWQTREDLFTQSFVLPFLVPMLESAGANVMLPRERDTNPHEIIIDNDGAFAHDGFKAYPEDGSWRVQERGFAHLKSSYSDGENPFKDGTSNYTLTTREDNESYVSWSASIPKDGTYALYVSYQSHPQSTTEALYTVFTEPAPQRFKVNQQMGGGSWVYLGSFFLKRCEEREIVRLSNRTSRNGEVVSADAIRIGGGIGNISRTPCDSLRLSGREYVESVSGFPRYVEGARYWLQWAGFDEEVYSPTQFCNDYKDDYMSRAHWVNALMGGSERLPDSVGLRIPIDLALAFHSDSGVRNSDETIGTLGIFCTSDNKHSFVGGASRYRSRDLTDLVMSEIVKVARSTVEPNWRRRGMWNRSYYEARVPAAPTMLLELLSHQNFADMRLGHDPIFKFMISRAIYKGILKHVSAQYGYHYIVQPLPVKEFSALLKGENRVELKWQEREDEFEPTALPDYYILYTSIDGEGFDSGVKISSKTTELELEPGRLYRFKLTAVNRGGESFPSEILSAAIAKEAKGEVLIINGFTRVSAPESFFTDSEAGFCSDFDSGVPYLYDLSHIGNQHTFLMEACGKEDITTTLGACHTDQECEIRAGNTFDYPALHGEAILKAGYSFASCSVDAAIKSGISTERYSVVDLILGKQRSTFIGRGIKGYSFECFPEGLQRLLQQHTENGGSLLVSGSYVASDLWQSDHYGDSDREFARDVLHIEYTTTTSPKVGKVRLNTPMLPIGTLEFNRNTSPTLYTVESPDVIQPYGKGAERAATYTEGGGCAAVIYSSEEYRALTLGFPIESIISPTERERLISNSLRFLNKK